MEIKGEAKAPPFVSRETLVKETYEWVIVDRTTWIEALKEVAAYWEENPDLGDPKYVTLTVTRDFNGPDKLKVGVEWNPHIRKTQSEFDR